jgi:hypothetical protein
MDRIANLCVYTQATFEYNKRLVLIVKSSERPRNFGLCIPVPLVRSTAIMPPLIMMKNLVSSILRNISSHCFLFADNEFAM